MFMFRTVQPCFGKPCFGKLGTAVVYAMLSCAMVAPTAFAQSEQDDLTTGEVIRNYIDAVGSEMSLRSIECVEFKAKLSGRINGSSQRIFQPDRFYVFYDMEGHGQTKRGFDGKFVWQNSLITGEKRVIEGVEHDMQTSHVEDPTLALRWLDFDGKIEKVGLETFEGVKTVQLRFTCKNGLEIDRFFRLDDHLIYKSTYEYQEVLYEEVVGPYEEHDGILLPSYVQYEDRAGGYRLDFEDIVLNGKVDDNIFEPEGGTESLVEIMKLAEKAARENAEAESQIEKGESSDSDKDEADKPKDDKRDK